MQTWRTIRLFISSTFHDMHAERDYLVKVVFPELRERMARRRLHLVDLDLRWGVTEQEAERGKVLEVILEEIDRSRPFFIAILGERYGSVPDKVPEDTEFAYPWIRDYPSHSITALEVIHGVLRNPELARCSFFYFRDPQVISHIPPGKRSDFIAESPEAERKLVILKDGIRASGRPVMENYHCRWDDREGRLVDLDGFGQRVLEDLWKAICEEYPEEVPEPDPLVFERYAHEAFVEERSRLFVGRTEQAERLTEYVQGTDRHPAVITGESGCGKSAFLTSWYRRYAAEHPDDFVLAYFIGASPDSTDHIHLLRNMCEELKRKFSLREEVTVNDRELPIVMGALLESASRGKSRIVIVLDGLDQLLPLEAAHELGWLLDYMPEGIRLVVSSLEGDCLEALRRHHAEEILLPPLSINEQRQIVQILLSEWGRKLDDKQMVALLAHKGINNPLYLRVALEELRLFGEFKQLTARIESLKEDVLGLFTQVLDRLEADHGRELVAETFSMLACSRYGLSETEILDLLRREGEEQFPRALWVRLARSARAYLVQRGELIGFFHDYLRKAVCDKDTPDEKQQRAVHMRLALYFETHDVGRRRVDELPWQLAKAEAWQRLYDLFSNLPFFDAAWEANEFEVREYWAQVEGNSTLRLADAYRSVVEKPARYDVLHLQHLAFLLHEMGHVEEALSLRTHMVNHYRQGGNRGGLAGALNDLALILKDKGELDQEMLLLKESEGICRDIGEREKLAVSLGEQAIIRFTRGELDEALKLHREEEGICRELGAKIKLANSLGRQAVIYRNRDQYDKALSMIEEGERIYREFGDKRNLEASLGNEAVILSIKGEVDRAMALHKEEEGICRELGFNLGLAISLGNQAIILRDQKKSEEAMSLLKEEESIYRDLNYKDGLHRNLDNQAIILMDKGNFKGALELQKEAELICRYLVNKEMLAANLGNQASNLQKQHDLMGAMSLLREEEQIFREINNKKLLASCLENQASIQRDYFRDLDKAMVLSKEGEGICRELDDKEGLAICLVNQARTTYKQDHLDESIALFKESERLSRGLDKKEILSDSLGGLVQIAIDREDWDSAMPLLKEEERLCSEIDERLAICLRNQAHIHHKSGNYEGALLLIKRALAIQERLPGSENPELAKSLNKLADIYNERGKYNEALPLYKRAVSIVETTIGFHNPDTMVYRDNLKACQATKNKADQMAIELRISGIVLIAFGIANVLQVEEFTNTPLGYAFLVIGMLALLIRARGMFILMGGSLLLAGLLEIVVGEIVSIMLGIILLFTGLYEISKFRKYIGM